MIDTTDIRRTCQNIQDGMNFNREKLARSVLDLCAQTEAQARTLQAERDRNKALSTEIEVLKVQLAQSKAGANKDFAGGLGDAFGDVFGDIFKPTGQYKKP